MPEPYLLKTKVNCGTLVEENGVRIESNSYSLMIYRLPYDITKSTVIYFEYILAKGFSNNETYFKDIKVNEIILNTSYDYIMVQFESFDRYAVPGELEIHFCLSLSES